MFKERSSASHAYVDGRNAYRDGKTSKDNPFPESPLEWAEWQVGLEDAHAEEQEEHYQQLRRINKLGYNNITKEKEMSIQTRSEENGLQQHASIAQAFQHAKEDPTVWKISFMVGGERIRLVSNGDNAWIHESMEDAMARDI